MTKKTGRKGRGTSSKKVAGKFGSFGLKSLILVAVVVTSGTVVVIHPTIINDVTNIILGNNSNSQNNQTNPTNPNNQTLHTNSFKNATLLPPFPTAKYNLAGGNQYADLHFEMQVSPPSQSDTQYTSMSFIGSISNMSVDLTNYPVNREDTFTFQTNVKDCLFSPGGNPYNGAPTYIPNETSAVTAGDINGNGQDEYIAVYSAECMTHFDSKLTIMEWNVTNNNFSTWADFHIALHDPQVLAADLKGLGTSEVIVAGFKTTTTSDLTIEIFDFAPNNQTVTNPNSLTITNITLSNTNLLPNRQVFLDKGNVEGSLNQQFFVYGQTDTLQYTCILLNYNLGTKTLTTITSWTDADLGRPIFVSWIYNGYQQMVFPKREEIKPANETYVAIPPVYPENVPLHTNESGFIYEIENNTAKKIVYFPYRGIVGAGNVKADGQTYIVLLDYCPSISCVNDIQLFLPVKSYILQDNAGSYIPLPEYQHYTSGVSFGKDVTNVGTLPLFRSNEKVFITDINFDGQPEIIFSGADATRFFWIRLNTLYSTLNNNNVISPYTPDLSVNYMDFTKSNIFNGFSNASVTGNFYNQSIFAKYRSVSYLSEGKPTILAVMAAPPTKSGISQNYVTSEVSFGQSQSQSSATERSFGYTVGAKLTFGIEFNPTLVTDEDKVETTFSYSFDYASTVSSKTTKSYEFSNTWTTDSAHNGVVYSAMQYKNWNYTILDANNPLFNGKTLTYSYPYYLGVYKFDADAFDAAHPGYNINSMTFNHTIGDPTTYPSSTLANVLMSGSPMTFKAPSLRPVNQGGAGDSQDISVSQEVSNTSTTDYTVGESAAVKFTTLGISMEAEASYSASWGEASEVSIGNGTVYSARIGQIANTNDWNNWSYGWGLFVYVLHRSDLNINYQVIDFYTGNFGVGYPSANTPSMQASKMVPTPTALPVQINTDQKYKPKK